MAKKMSGCAGSVHLVSADNDPLHFCTCQCQCSYVRVMMAADVHLDPFPFGGGLTTAELIGLHLPVVTLPGSHRSGRLTTAMYVCICMEIHPLDMLASIANFESTDCESGTPKWA